MTEAEWLVCPNPLRMLDERRHLARATERKLCLFGVACCRRVWSLLSHSASRRAVELAERKADGEVLQEGEWRDIELAAHRAIRRTVREEALAARGASLVTGRFAVVGGDKSDAAELACALMDISLPRRLPECPAQCQLLRDIFGNPFRPVPVIELGWLSWDDGTVRKLASHAYDERLLPEGTLDPVRLAVLADAREDAGCTDAELLGHLRGPGPHVRGCWALDLVLSKS
jgi:hypothetical protein